MPVKILTEDDMLKLVGWFLSGDTGISSETMVAIATGAKRGTIRFIDAPYDPADFARCYRLVEHIPNMRKAFPDIARRCKPFKHIIKEWDRLCAIYERDLDKGQSPELYAEIKRLRAL